MPPNRAALVHVAHFVAGVFTGRRRVAVDVLRERDGRDGPEVLCRVRPNTHSRKAVVGALRPDGACCQRGHDQWLRLALKPGDEPKTYGPYHEVWLPKSWVRKLD